MLSYGAVSVRLSVTSWYCIETTGGIEFVFGVDATLGLTYMLKNNSCTFKTKDTSWNFVPNWTLENFATARRPSHGRRSPVYHTKRPPLWRRAGLCATAETCSFYRYDLLDG